MWLLVDSKRLDALAAQITALHQMAARNFLILEGKADKIMSVLDDVQAAVTAEDTVIDSAIALLQGLSAALTAAGTDPTKLAALKADITAKTTSLAAAVAANPVAAPAPAGP